MEVAERMRFCCLGLIGLGVVVGACACAEGAAATQPTSTSTVVRIRVDTSQAPDLDPWARRTLIPVLQAWYPRIVAELPVPHYTPPDHFSILFDVKYKGVAQTVGTFIVANPQWFREQIGKEAVGALVHEEVHVVQQPFHVFHGRHMPTWLLEGSADYIRWFEYEPAKLRPHPTGDEARYDASYRVSAAFLQWVINNYDKDIIVQMNVANYQGVYSDELWVKYTGKTAARLGAQWKAQLARQ
jgi:hypothetical protein